MPGNGLARIFPLEPDLVLIYLVSQDYLELDGPAGKTATVPPEISRFKPHW